MATGSNYFKKLKAACKLSRSITVSLSFTERSNSTKDAQKKHHGTTTTPRSRKKRQQTQEALALTGYSASYRHKTRGEPQEPSSSCEQTVYRAPGPRSAPPARSIAASVKHAYYDLKVCIYNNIAPRSCP